MKKKEKNKVREITYEEIQKLHIGRRFSLTVGELKEFIQEHNVSDEAVVMIQRVEDVYYEKHNWGVYKKEGESYNRAVQHNKDIDSEKYLDKEQYPLIKENDEILEKVTEEEMESLKTQYTFTHCCVKYDENDILFIDLHC